MNSRSAMEALVREGSNDREQDRVAMAHHRPLRVLMADDYEANRMLQLAQLEQLGYATDAVANGEEVIRALAARAYDVVLLDIGMPVLDGVETARRIRARRRARQPYLVAVTAGTAEVDHAGFEAAGFDAFIAKPAAIEDFVAVLERAHTSLYGANACDQLLSPSDSGPVHDVAPSESCTDPLARLLLRRVVPIYLRELPARIAGLRAAFEARDAAALASLCHALKGAARILDRQALAVACDDMERIAYDGRLPDAATLDDLIGLATDTGEEVRQELAAAQG